jgi:hypothetical protein
MLKINKKPSKLLIVNYFTILITIYKIFIFVSIFGMDVFDWWIPQGQVFSYVHYWHFSTFVLMPLPFGVYFLVLVFYLISAILLNRKFKNGEYRKKHIVYAMLLLFGVLGSFVSLIGE